MWQNAQHQQLFHNQWKTGWKWFPKRAEIRSFHADIWMRGTKTGWYERGQYMRSIHYIPQCRGSRFSVRVWCKIDSCQILNFFPTLRPHILSLVHWQSYSCHTWPLKKKKSMYVCSEEINVPMTSPFFWKCPAISAGVVLSEGRRSLFVYTCRHMWRRAATRATTSCAHTTLSRPPSQLFAVSIMHPLHQIEPASF